MLNFTEKFMTNISSSTNTCAALLAEFREIPPKTKGAHKLSFAQTDVRDVYNITAPFQFGDITLLAARVEKRDSEHAETHLFTPAGRHWVPVEKAPLFEGLQDPCVTIIDGELILGGVLYPVPTTTTPHGWKMKFFRGSSLDSMSHFLTGPENMKDIRLKQLADRRIAVLTRPQGGQAGLGCIGFRIADSLDVITPEWIAEAPVYISLCCASEWVGGNEMHQLSNGKIGVLGHIACIEPSNCRNYYPMVFAINPESGDATPPRIIAERKQFPVGGAKRSGLQNVVFSGGIIRNSDGSASLYAGLGDIEAGLMQLFPDPFALYEQQWSHPPHKLHVR